MFASVLIYELIRTKCIYPTGDAHTAIDPNPPPPPSCSSAPTWGTPSPELGIPTPTWDSPARALFWFVGSVFFFKKKSSRYVPRLRGRLFGLRPHTRILPRRQNHAPQASRWDTHAQAPRVWPKVRSFYCFMVDHRTVA